MKGQKRKEQLKAKSKIDNIPYEKQKFNLLANHVEKRRLSLRLRETHNAFQLPVFFLFFFSASLIRNIGEFGAKNYFTDHQTANTIHLFVPI